MRNQSDIFTSPFSGKNIRFGIVGARFNPELTNSLVTHAVRTLLEHGVADADIQVLRVPGCYEVPLACSVLAKSGKVDGLIAVGVIIEGATPHFDKLCTDVTASISRIILDTHVPIGFGVVMAHTIEQANERASDTNQNKGREAAVAALEMVSLIKGFATEI